MTNANDKNRDVKPNKTDNSAKGATDAFREGWFEIRTTAEIPIISKIARVVEEVVIGKQTSERAETIRDSVIKTVVEVSKISTDEMENRRND